MPLFKATVESMLLYGSDSRSLTKSLEKKLDSTYTLMLSKVHNIPWKDNVTNSFSTARTHVSPRSSDENDLVWPVIGSWFGWSRVKTQWASCQSSVMETWWAEKSGPPQNYPKENLGRWYWFGGTWNLNCYVGQSELEEEFRHVTDFLGWS